MPIYEHKLKEQLKKLAPPQREALLGQLADDLAARRVEIIGDPAEETQAELEQPGFSELYSPEATREQIPEEPQQRPVGVPGPGFRVSRGSMGPGRASPAEVPAAVAGATLPYAVPTSLGGAAKAGLALGATEIAERKLGLRMPWWADALLAWRFGRGGLGLKGITSKMLGKGAKKKGKEQLKKKVAKEVTGGPPSKPTPRVKRPKKPSARKQDDRKAAQEEALGIAKQIRTWKNKQKLSEGQIVSSLREKYGWSGKEARQWMRLALEG